MARPAEFDEPATAVIRCRITPSQMRDLAQVARDNDTDLSGVIRQAVNEYVSDYRDRKVFRRTERPDTP
jgi:hypothetical protein